MHRRGKSDWTQADEDLEGRIRVVLSNHTASDEAPEALTSAMEHILGPVIISTQWKSFSEVEVQACVLTSPNCVVSHAARGPHLHFLVRAQALPR